MYFAVGMHVGDAVIVEPEPDWKIPATVISFSERGAHVRSEEPGAFHGRTLTFAFYRCRVVDQDNEEWKSLAGTASPAQ